MEREWGSETEWQETSLVLLTWPWSLVVSCIHPQSCKDLSVAFRQWKNWKHQVEVDRHQGKWAQ